MQIMEPTSPNFLEPPFRVSKNFRCPPLISSSPPLAILNELFLETFKYLRIVLDSNISWSSHVDYLCNKISSRIGILKRIMPCLTLPSAQTVYKSTIQPLVSSMGCIERDIISTITETNSRTLSHGGSNL